MKVPAEAKLTKEERGGLGCRHRKVRIREKRGREAKIIQHIYKYGDTSVANCILKVHYHWFVVRDAAITPA